MGFSRENMLIGMPKITEGAAVFVFMRDSLPELKTGRLAAITYDECHNLPCSAAHRCPHPSFLLFLLHKTPNFIEFEHIIWGRRQKGFFDIRQVLDVRFEPARHGLPRNGKDPRHSTQATTLQAIPQYGLLLSF